MDNEKNNITKVEVKSMPAMGASGPVLCFNFSVLCYLCWLNMMGVCGQGAGIAIGMCQLGVFVPYVVASAHFWKMGDSFSGNIFMVFAGFFACIGGLTNIAGDICAFIGMPFSPVPGGFCWLICGILLLGLLPAVRYDEPYTFLFYIFGGIALADAGIVTLGLVPSTAFWMQLGAWTNFGAATCGMVLVFSYMSAFKGVRMLPGMDKRFFHRKNEQ